MTHWFPSGRRRILESLIQVYAPQPGQIADIGCGTGANLEMLAKFAPTVGIDFFPQAIAYCRMRGLSRTAVAGLPRLPFRDGAFGLVCAFDVIEHLDDDQSAVSELLRICRPGGILLITVPAYNWLWSQHDEANYHKRRYVRDMLRRLFTTGPAEVIRLSHFNLLLAPPIVLVRLLGKLKDKLFPPREVKLDLAETPAFFNRLLLALFSAERHVLRHFNFPAGISVVCVVRKR
jgi:SAM-dependent methyltransferase